MGKKVNLSNSFKKVLSYKEYWIMLLPCIVFFIVFSYLPMAGIYYAFTRYDFAKGLFNSPFTGLKNFEFLFSGGKDSIIWLLTRNTVLYNLSFILIGTSFQVIVAIIIFELPGKIFKKALQSCMFLPHFISFVIVGLFVYNFCSYDVGVLNSIIKEFGGDPVNIYTTPEVWKYILNFVNVWKGLGYGTVVYLATLVGIDKAMFEAADLDGASVLQRIWHITLPSIRPTIVILLLFSLGSIVRGQFDMFYQLIGKNGLLYNTADIIDTYVYRSLTVNFDLGLGTAAGLYQSTVGFVTVLLVNKIVKTIEPDYSLF
ncbi:MAG: ABC transporter permease subunit [Clostridiales bacterium]|jgi:putative aldouronate transport system permease protein|nr:ABC transporter permease subunit [Clostridiales bacterium]